MLWSAVFFAVFQASTTGILVVKKSQRDREI
jgi:hypothetical protein